MDPIDNVTATDAFVIPDFPPDEFWLGLESDDEKFLDNQKWGKLQLYLKTSQLLPTTQQNLELQFGDNVTEVLSTKVITLLIDAYSTIGDTCDSFQNNYYQLTSLANDIVSYVRDMESFYPKVDEVFDSIARAPTYDAFLRVVSEQLTIFACLSDRTVPFRDKVRSRTQFIRNFKQDTDDDQRLVAELNERVARADFEIQMKIDMIKKDVEEKRTTFEKLNREHEDVLQKRQSVPWYVCIPIAGGIAGPIVARQAFVKAKATWDDIHRRNKELEHLDLVFRQAESLKATAVQINGQVKDLSAQFAGALDCLTIMDAAWSRMFRHLMDIIAIFGIWQQHNMSLLHKVSFHNHHVRWAEVMRLANDYVSRALVVVNDPTG